jgi:hypothetical protein
MFTASQRAIPKSRKYQHRKAKFSVSMFEDEMREQKFNLLHDDQL